MPQIIPASNCNFTAQQSPYQGKEKKKKKLSVSKYTKFRYMLELKILISS
jgi:hypothetical protein